MKATSISTTDAARHLGDVLARVKHKGEHFLLTKNDRPVATLAPAAGTTRATWGQLESALALLPWEPGFADDLEKVNAADTQATNPWL